MRAPESTLCSIRFLAAKPRSLPRSLSSCSRRGPRGIRLAVSATEVAGARLLKVRRNANACEMSLICRPDSATAADPPKLAYLTDQLGTPAYNCGLSYLDARVFASQGVWDVARHRSWRGLSMKPEGRASLALRLRTDVAISVALHENDNVVPKCAVLCVGATSLRDNDLPSVPTILGRNMGDRFEDTSSTLSRS
jgi:hypothetical protein